MPLRRDSGDRLPLLPHRVRRRRPRATGARRIASERRRPRPGEGRRHRRVLHRATGGRATCPPRSSNTTAGSPPWRHWNRIAASPTRAVPASSRSSSACTGRACRGATNPSRPPAAACCRRATTSSDAGRCVRQAHRGHAARRATRSAAILEARATSRPERCRRQLLDAYATLFAESGLDTRRRRAAARVRTRKRSIPRRSSPTTRRRQRASRRGHAAARLDRQGQARRSCVRCASSRSGR